jgi:protein subunit release factor B
MTKAWPAVHVTCYIFAQCTEDNFQHQKQEAKQIVIPQQCPEQKISEQDQEAEAVQDHHHTMQLGTDIQCHFGRNQAA